MHQSAPSTPVMQSPQPGVDLFRIPQSPMMGGGPPRFPEIMGQSSMPGVAYGGATDSGREEGGSASPHVSPYGEHKRPPPLSMTVAALGAVSSPRKSSPGMLSFAPSLQQQQMADGKMATPGQEQMKTPEIGSPQVSALVRLAELKYPKFELNNLYCSGC